MNNLPISYFPVIHSSYVGVYNPKTRNPDWIRECLTVKDITGKVDRSRFSFTKDSQIPPKLQAAVSDFIKKGFHKGHLAAAANHKSSQKAMKETFQLSNVSPFNPKLNQGYWSRLEKRVRDLTYEYGHIHVTSGPLFLPKIIEENGKRYKMQEVIGENNISVPTHFFKVIDFANELGEIETEAYVIPNDPIEKTISLKTFQTTIEEVENLANMIFRHNEDS